MLVFSFLCNCFFSVDQSKILKGLTQCSKQILYIRSTTCRSTIFWCSPLSRTVCLLLNTTLEKCKPDGLKMCEKHERTGIWQVPLHLSVNEKRVPWLAADDLCLRSQPEIATSSWKQMFPHKVRYKWRATVQTVRVSLFL